MVGLIAFVERRTFRSVIKAFITRRPVATYFALNVRYLMGQRPRGGWSQYPSHQRDFERLFPFRGTAMIAGPQCRRHPAGWPSLCKGGGPS